MNKKFAAFFKEQGMTVTGDQAYGIIRGYEVNAAIIRKYAAYPLLIHISFYGNDQQKRYIEDNLRNARIKYCRFEFTPYGLSISLNDLTLGRLVGRLPMLMDMFLGIISQNGALTSEYCPVCGHPFGEQRKQCRIDGFTIHIDPVCFLNINAVIEAENADFANAPNNYIQGFLGALIGGAVGAVVAIVLYFIGFYSSIAAVVSIMLGSVLYKKFHGKPNKMMLVIVALTTVMCMALSVFLIYFAAAGMIAIEAGADVSAMQAFVLLMDDAEFSKAFYVDLGMVLLFSAIGIVIQIASTARSIKRKSTIQ